MRNAVTLCLLAIAGCSNAAPDAQQRSLTGATVEGDRAPVSDFVPPTPAGCAGASAYDVCFALEGATPLAVRVTLPQGARPNAVAVARFHRVSGKREPLDVDQVKFTSGGSRELRLYFQVHPGSYRIEVGVDADGDGDAEGAADDIGWSAATPNVPVVDEAAAAIVDVGTTPIETAFALAPRR